LQCNVGEDSAESCDIDEDQDIAPPVPLGLEDSQLIKSTQIIEISKEWLHPLIVQPAPVLSCIIYILK
jgi:hypothetical protein